MSKKKALQPTSIGKRMQIIANMSGPLREEMPWEVMPLWPKAELFGSQIGFCDDGDMVSREEAITALEWMLAELRRECE
jgi:hypothetical protein